MCMRAWSIMVSWLLMTALGSAGAASRDAQVAEAVFAGGCFWCMEEAFENVGGVVSVISGYTGGRVPRPTYEEVSGGGTGHAESVQILYDPSKIGYAQLLEIFWRNIDPTTRDQQFCDSGSQYRSAIFYQDDTQRRLAEESRRTIERTKSFKEPIVTEIVPAGDFYPAEDYHQDFYKKNSIRYKLYKWNCGRAQRLAQLWREAGQPPPQ